MVITFKNTVAAASIAVTSFFGSMASAAVIDLGFIMDRSDSVTEAQFTDAMNSLGNALENGLVSTIGSANTYVVSVVVFNSGSQDVVGANRVTVNSVAALTGLATAVRSAGALGTTGSTNYQAGFNQLANNYGAGELGDFSIVNMMTDGVANGGNSTAGRDALRAAGWDSLSFESIGGNASDAVLQALAFDTGGVGGAALLTDPNDITDPLNSSFVLKVDNFGADYDAAIAAKVQRIVTPQVPLPAGLPLMLGGLAILGAISRRRSAAAA